MMKKINKLVIAIMLLLMFPLCSFYYDNVCEYSSYLSDDSRFNYLLGDNNLDDKIKDMRNFKAALGNDSIIITKKMTINDAVNNTAITSMFISYTIDSGYLTEITVVISEGTNSNLIYMLTIESDTSYTVNVNTGYDFYEIVEYAQIVNSSYEYSIKYNSYVMDKLMELYNENLGMSFMYAFKYKLYTKYYVKANTAEIEPLEVIAFSNVKAKTTFIYDTNYKLYDGALEKGIYYAKRFTLSEANEIHLEEYEIEAYDFNEDFSIENICVRYNDPITFNDYYKYINVYTNCNILSISSRYFDDDCDKSILSKYRSVVKIEIPKYNEIITRISTIEVVDDIAPVVNVLKALETTTDIKLENKDILSAITAHDEYDGDNLSYHVEDVNDYANNYDKKGTFEFKISVTDLSDNTSLVSVKLFVSEKAKEEETPDDTSNQLESFTTNTNEPLTEDFLKRKLIMLGYFNNKENIVLTSDYFSNQAKAGSYTLHASDKLDSYEFTIVVSEVESKSNSGTNALAVILPIAGGVIIICAAIFVIVRRKKSKTVENDTSVEEIEVVDEEDDSDEE